MRIDENSAISGMVMPWLDGKPIDRCLWLDMEKEQAEVMVADWQGRLILDEQGDPVTRRLHGKIELRPVPGKEEAVRFYLFGWAESRWYYQGLDCGATLVEGEGS